MSTHCWTRHQALEELDVVAQLFCSAVVVVLAESRVQEDVINFICINQLWGQTNPFDSYIPYTSQSLGARRFCCICACSTLLVQDQTAFTININAK